MDISFLDNRVVGGGSRGGAGGGEHLTLNTSPERQNIQGLSV